MTDWRAETFGSTGTKAMRDAWAVSHGEMSRGAYADAYGQDYGSGVNGLGNGLLSLGVLLVPTNPEEYFASLDPQDPNPSKRESFEGGKLYGRDELWQGLMDMWYASRKIDGLYRENMGIFTDKGLLVLPNDRNGQTRPGGRLHSGGSVIFMNGIISKDGLSLNYGKHGNLQILGAIHTHPSPSGLQGHSDSSDTLFHDYQVGSFVISTKGLYHWINGDSYWASANAFGAEALKYINDLYSKRK